MKVWITDLKTSRRQVELPAECPKCGIKIGPGARITACQLTAEEQNCSITSDGNLDDYSSVKSFCEYQLVQGYKCDCSETLVMGEDVDETPPQPHTATCETFCSIYDAHHCHILTTEGCDDLVDTRKPT